MGLTSSFEKVPTISPSLKTEILSENPKTSSILCEVKTIEIPSDFSLKMSCLKNVISFSVNEDVGSSIKINRAFCDTERIISMICWCAMLKSFTKAPTGISKSYS